MLYKYQTAPVLTTRVTMHPPVPGDNSLIETIVEQIVKASSDMAFDAYA